MAKSERTLQDLPNIGTNAAKLLSQVGISTPEELKRLGSVEAVFRIKTSLRGESPCRSMLSALEGAIRGIRWHKIPKPERDKLWAEFQRRLDEE